MKPRALACAGSAALLLAGCSNILGYGDAPPGFDCATDRDCQDGYVCFLTGPLAGTCVAECPSGYCRDSAADLSPTTPMGEPKNVDPDASTNMSADADASTKGPPADVAPVPDAVEEDANERDVTGEDATLPVDASIDASLDTSLDASIDASLDTSLDASDDGMPVLDAQQDAFNEGESAVEAAIPEGGTCFPGEGRCLSCDSNGHWEAGGQYCPAACSENTGCLVPPSCNGLQGQCGDPTSSCCNAQVTPGGPFLRSCDALRCIEICQQSPGPGTVSNFALDKFETTVGRFRQFVNDYANAKPRAGQGRNPNNPQDMGWDSSWLPNLPQDGAAMTSLLANCPGTTWTPTIAGNEAKPINCVNWYVAFAFCIWDGGRLPTEEEWNYIAAGGSDNRIYPWSQPPQNSSIGSMYAIYQSNPPATGPDIVGKASLGMGRWGHFDLVGNVAEWMRDAWSDCYSTPDQCDDCANLTTGGTRAYRGGSYFDDADGLQISARADVDPLARYSFIGMRCARNP